MTRLDSIPVACLVLLALAGCVDLQALRTEQAQHTLVAAEASKSLSFLVKVHTSSGVQRESLWKQARALPGNHADVQLQRALLQSFSGHSGTDNATAEQKLKGLIYKYPDTELAAVARIRLIELRTERQLAMERDERMAELRQVKAQLNQLIEIEKHLDSKPGSDAP